MTTIVSDPLGITLLTKLIESNAVTIRGCAVLEPAVGAGDKVFPPSHAIDDKRPEPSVKYAFETRNLGGEKVDCVLLDSVQSPANRMEEAPEALWATGRIPLPVIPACTKVPKTKADSMVGSSLPERVRALQNFPRGLAHGL